MTVVLEARNVNKSFGAVTAASDINVRVEQGSVVGLIGSNGAGKTTFINMVTGYLKPTSGTILYRDRDITGLSPRQVTQLGICRSFQIPQLFSALDVYDNLRVGVGIAARSPAAAERQIDARSERQHVEQLIERFRLSDYRSHPASMLPEGIRKLLDIAMAVAGRPRVLAFYEGRIIADGDPADVLAHAEVRRYVIGEDLHRRAAKEASNAAN
jgi:branched-chain amino acid transport system ATP-binding protein